VRLLIISQDFPPSLGGIQTYALELASRLAPMCEYLGVVAPRQPGDSHFDAALPFPVYRQPFGDDLLALPALRAVPRLAAKHRVDVALHAQWQPVVASVRSRQATGYPRRILLPAHGRETLFNPWPGPLAGVYERWRRWSFQSADRVLPVSHYNAELVRRLGVSEDRVTVVNNGTNTHLFYPSDASDLRRRLGLEGQRVILGLGRLISRKGYDTTIEALPHVLRHVPDAVYVVIGQGPDRPRLERMADELGVASRVRFLGSVPYDELPPYYNLADVYVMPARSEPPDVEGFGIVFLEANACGKPVIGARDGGVPDAVMDGETGLLIDPGNATDLSNKLVRILTDPRLANRLGETGRQRVASSLTWDHVATRIHAIAMQRE
jgi:phosphatidyl-myo-inositol dimannoside synthase